LTTLAAVLLNFSILLSDKQEHKYLHAKVQAVSTTLKLLKTLDGIQLSSSQIDQAVVDAIFYCFVGVGNYIYHDDDVINTYVLNEGLNSIAKGFLTHKIDKLREASKELLLLMQVKKE